MPPMRKIQKEEIIKAGVKILEKENLESLTARRVANELNCSVQPIFHNFENMEELKHEVCNEIYKIYQSYMIKGSQEEQPYKGMGMAYIRFAKDYPNYFKLIFMMKTTLTPDHFIVLDSMGNNVIEMGMKFTGLSYDEQKDFHVKVWIFTHGIATLAATNTVQLSENEIERLLSDTVRTMLKGIRKG